jgi:hypothetical protein
MIYNVGGNFREECLELPQGASQSFAPGAGGVKQVLLEPGEFALFHNNIVHGSPPNRAARGRRAGLGIRPRRARQGRRQPRVRLPWFGAPTASTTSGPTPRRQWTWTSSSLHHWIL